MGLPWPFFRGFNSNGINTGSTTSCGCKTSSHIPLRQRSFLQFEELTCTLLYLRHFCLHQTNFLVERVHRPSTLSLPADSILIGSLLSLVGLISLSLFFLLTWVPDVDAVSLASAQSNVDRNELSERITVLCADPMGPIMLPLVQNTATSCVMHIIKSLYPEFTMDVDSILACVTHHSIQAPRKLCGQRRRRSFNPMPSVHLRPAIFGQYVIHSRRFAPVPRLR